MADPFTAEIRLFGGNFAPKDWALCNGQVLSIAQYTAVFSLVGTNFGGNGTTNFALPNLQSRAPMGVGAGPGLSPRNLGDAGGEPNVTLTVDQLPQHNHGSSGVDVTATSHLAGGNLFADTSTSFNMYQAPSSNITAMATSSVDPAGGGQPHNNLQPYLAVNYIFCLQGIFPPRPPG